MALLHRIPPTNPVIQQGDVTLKNLTNYTGIQPSAQAIGFQLPSTREFANNVLASYWETWSGDMGFAFVAVLVFGISLTNAP